MTYHVALIMDGNRRWAKQNSLPALEGHRKGAETLKQVIKWGEELGLRELTFYAFSTENFKRSEEEKQWLWNLVAKLFKKDAELSQYKINFIGNLSLFPENIQQIAKELQENTKTNNFPVNICFGYGGREEIVQACNKAIENGDPVSEETFKEFLYLKEDPDMVIRTGGAQRTSNFLPWQTAYSEWFFLDTFWPAFSKQDLTLIIENFQLRKRNFGK